MSQENPSTLITTFYKFTPLNEDSLESIKAQLESWATDLTLMGLVLIGTEGINASVAGEPKSIEQFKKNVLNVVDHSIWFKDSWGPKKPFSRFKVKIKSEIVTLGRPDLVPKEELNNHLTPAEWHKTMQEEDVVVVDTRNKYETDIGLFKGALDFRIDDFQEFTQKMEESGIDKNKKVLIYCTGGIRCEKAILELKEKGYKNVFQLHGGILNYLKEFPEGHWQGECFVFDHRVAVDGQLQPSQKYSLCPHCGQPANTPIECKQCGREESVCHNCLKVSADKHTCSKNCANHFRIGSQSRNVHEDSFRKRSNS